MSQVEDIISQYHHNQELYGHMVDDIEDIIGEFSHQIRSRSLILLFVLKVRKHYVKRSCINTNIIG